MFPSSSVSIGIFLYVWEDDSLFSPHWFVNVKKEQKTSLFLQSNKSKITIVLFSFECAWYNLNNIFVLSVSFAPLGMVPHIVSLAGTETYLHTSSYLSKGILYESGPGCFRLQY